MAATSLNAPAVWMPSLPGLFAVSTSIGSNSTFTFNGAADKMAFIFQATSTTPPDRISFRCTSHTTTGTIDVTLEAVDATTGLPSGTPVTNSATGSVSVAATGTNTATGIQGTAALTVGDFYAVVLTATAGFGGSFVVLRTTGTNGGTGSPYSLTKDSAGAWAKLSSTNCGLAIGFFNSSGASIYMPAFAGAYTAAFQTFADSTNPDERGNRFALPVPATCVGVAVFANLGTTPTDVNSFTIALYSGHTGGTPTLLASKAIDGDNQEANAYRALYFDAPVSLSAATTYAIAMKATGSTGPSLLRHSYAAAAELGGYLSDDFYSTTRDGGSGAFTDANTDVYAVYPILSAFDDGAGGAGGGMIRHCGMQGGING